MPTRTANAQWRGDLKKGKGEMELGSGAWKGPFSFQTRFGEERGANPEELIGAAEAGCFSMALAHNIDQAGHKPNSVHTTAKVTIEKDPSDDGFKISSIALTTEVDVPKISKAEFEKVAEKTRTGCPVSKALKGTTITLEAKLKSEK